MWICIVLGSLKRSCLPALEVTLVEIPDGEDLLHALAESCRDYMPAIIFSVLGAVGPAHLRVPKDECIPEVVNDAPFGVKMQPEGMSLEDYGVPISYPTQEEMDAMPNVSLKPKPHWYEDESFVEPLTIVYGMGGQSKPTSNHNFHLILSGSSTRPGGRGETFVGQLKSGTYSRGVWVVLGAASAYERGCTVQSITLSIEIGEEVMTTIARFLASPRAADIGKSFIWSAKGQVSSAVLRIPGEHENEDLLYTLEETENGEPYEIEAMTALFGAGGKTRVHAAFILQPKGDEVHGESAGGELVSAMVAGDLPLDLFIGETISRQEYVE
jgi:hypothetical protein